MDNDKVKAISAAMSSFIAFLGVLSALLYYLYQIKKLNPLEVMIISEIYIISNLTFLYIIKRGLK